MTGDSQFISKLLQSRRLMHVEYVLKYIGLNEKSNIAINIAS